MAVYFATHQAGIAQVAVLGTAGKRIRVRRLIVSTDTNSTFVLQQDVGGAAQADVSPRFQARAGGTALNFSFPNEKPETAPGHSLGYLIDAVSATSAVWIEYDIVE